MILHVNSEVFSNRNSEVAAIYNIPQYYNTITNTISDDLLEETSDEALCPNR